jgi:capsular polysaccharide biosynthesis protein
VDRLMVVPRLPRQPPERLPDRDELYEVADRVGRLAGASSGARRVYLSRADARRRRAVNEVDVVTILRAHDFEIIRIDASGPAEQIRASLGAELVVGVHGAALTNLMFMAEGGRLLELRHPRHHWDVYRKLSAMFGVEYRSQVCGIAEGLGQPDDQHADLVVDLDELRENLREWT